MGKLTPMAAAIFCGTIFAAVAAVDLFGPVFAQESPPPWFSGQWNCTLEGAAGQLILGYGNGDPRDNPADTHCDGNLCSSTYDNPAPLGGTYQYSTGPHIYFRMFSQDAPTFALSTRDQGDIWFFQEGGTSNHLTGNATYNAVAHPVECWRVGTPTTGELTQTPSGGVPASQLAQQHSTISVISATYGGDCGAHEGNATASLAKTCNGKFVCEYTIDYRIIGDPAPYCRKNYVAKWSCGSSSPLTTQAGAEAGFGSKVELTCAPP